MRPMPRNVPTNVAHSGVGRDAPAACPEPAEGTAGGTPALPSVIVRSISGVSFTILRPDLPACSPGFAPRYLYRRRNHVSAARPLAQINGAAAVAAEGKFRVSAHYDFLADGAAKLESVFARHVKSISGF